MKKRYKFYVNPKLNHLVNKYCQHINVFSNCTFEDKNIKKAYLNKEVSAIYHNKADLIIINDLIYENVLNRTMTLLHELIHFTGHEKRLNRKNISYSHAQSKNYHTEEMTAEYGTLFLLKHYKLPYKNFLKRIKILELYYSLANFKKAKKQAREAVKFLMDSIK